MTISLSHSINERGLDNLDLPSGPVIFYFVTPEVCVRGVKIAKVGEGWRRRIKQKIVGIKLSNEIMKRYGSQNDEIMGWGREEDDVVDDIAMTVWRGGVRNLTLAGSSQEHRIVESQLEVGCWGFAIFPVYSAAWGIIDCRTQGLNISLYIHEMPLSTGVTCLRIPPMPCDAPITKCLYHPSLPQGQGSKMAIP